MSAIPRILKNFNLFVDGQGHAGLCDTVNLPTLQITTEDHRAGGMDAAIPIDMGMEPMELSFSMAEHIPAIFRQFGLFDQNGVAVVFRAALADNANVIPYVVTARGMMTQIGGSEVQTGQKVPLEATIRCNYLRIQIGGEVLVEIDVINMVRRIGGVDQLEAMRNAINA